MELESHMQLRYAVVLPEAMMAPASLLPNISTRWNRPAPSFWAPAAALWPPWILQRQEKASQEEKRKQKYGTPKRLREKGSCHPESRGEINRTTSMRAPPAIDDPWVPPARDLDAEVGVAMDVAVL